jgi:hypothetical protein
MPARAATDIGYHPPAKPHPPEEFGADGLIQGQHQVIRLMIITQSPNIVGRGRVGLRSASGQETVFDFA